jgi:hypothetical protein
MGIDGISNLEHQGNDEIRLTKERRDSLNGYTATLSRRFNDLTVQPFNEANPLVICHDFRLANLIGRH